MSAAAALFQWHKAIGQSVNGAGIDADLDPERARLAAEAGKREDGR